MRLEWGEVTEIRMSSDSIEKLSVALDSDAQGSAINYPRLAGQCCVGERVLLNVTAGVLSLGTGGYHFVVARATSATGLAYADDSKGHIMKLRYTPLQHDVLAVEESASQHHGVMARAESLLGMPVACCGLHSQVPLVAAAIKAVDSDLKVTYVMTDQAALPLALSEVTQASVSAGLVDSTITCGHAFGGDIEAVNLYSALLAARHVESADVAVVGIGPGVVGTATPFGHGGIAQGEAINAASSLGGRPVAVLRMSEADDRPRHRGVSHHTLTALSKVAIASAFVSVPAVPHALAAEVERSLEDAGVWSLHRRANAREAMIPPMRGVEVRSMGRGQENDPVFFSAAYAAGDLCARLALGHVP